MVSVVIVVLLPLWSVLATATPQCQAPGQGCTSSSGLVLLQTHHTSSTVELGAASAGPVAIQSGDAVLFRVARTGHRLTAQEDGRIHAEWDQDGEWQRFVIEKESGGGDIRSGDAVFLVAWTGKPVTVGDEVSGSVDHTALHAKWDQRGDWQKLTIEKGGEAGPIVAGDEVFLQAWTGAWLDADTPDAEGAVQARYGDQGEWQKLIIEAAAPPATAATTAAPQTDAEQCVEKHSLGQCHACLNSEQCGAGRYCCPYMKKCVSSTADYCFPPIAMCRPQCPDSMDVSQCRCANRHFPEQWQLPTCASATER